VTQAAAETTRERIIRVGTELFARNGFHGTGIGALSEAAGLGRGALYHHIRTKEELLYEISMGLLARMTDEARALVAEGGDPEATLRRLARALVREHAMRKDAWALVVTEVRALTPEHRAAVIGARRDYEQIWADVLSAGADAGVVRPVDGLERRAILGMLNSTRRWISVDGPLDVDEVADRHIDLVLRGIGTEGA
jgi:TetR/AcrR family transcriptional regulator, cholesterol catabolism regulator